MWRKQSKTVCVAVVGLSPPRFYIAQNNCWQKILQLIWPPLSVFSVCNINLCLLVLSKAVFVPRYHLCASCVPALSVRLEIAVLEEWSDSLLVCFYGKIFCCCNCSAPQVAMAASLVQRENHAASDVLRKVKVFILKSSIILGVPIYCINYTVTVKD